MISLTLDSTDSVSNTVFRGDKSCGWCGNIIYEVNFVNATQKSYLRYTLAAESTDCSKTVMQISSLITVNATI